jgi:hypothetical protein
MYGITRYVGMESLGMLVSIMVSLGMESFGMLILV